MPKNFVLFALLTFGVAAGQWVQPSFGATSKTSFGVSATVLAKCEMSAVTGYQSYAQAIAKAGSGLSVRCNNFVPYTVTMMPLSKRLLAVGSSANPERGNYQVKSPEANAGLAKSTAAAKSISIPSVDSVSSEALLLIVTY